MRCENCRKVRTWRKSAYWTGNRRWWLCRCGHWQLGYAPIADVVPPKILYLDIETSLIEMKVQVFDMRVRSGWLDWHDITQPFYVISWAAAWLQDDIRVMSDAVTATEALKRDDKRCLTRLWNLIDSADYVVGHNSKSFDVKKIETRFLLNRMGTPTEFKQFDTLTKAKQRLKPESQALDYWARLLGGNKKDHMIREDWQEVNKGNQRIINKMRHYNKGDVREGVHILKEFKQYFESNGARLFQ